MVFAEFEDFLEIDFLGFGDSFGHFTFSSVILTSSGRSLYIFVLILALLLDYFSIWLFSVLVSELSF